MLSSIERVPGPVSSNDWTSGLRQRLAVYVLITTVFTMILVNYSMRHGRLAIGPTDDDCLYLVDALQRLDILHQTPKQFVKNLYAYPPHSPFSTALGVLAFAIFGPKQWAPYVSNGLVLLVLLLMVDYLTSRATREARIAAILFTLSFPFTANVITEFRPDCAVGVAMAFGLVLLLRASPLAASRSQALFVGALAAIALLVKPSFAPYIVVSFGAAWIVSAFFVHLAKIRRGFELKRALGKLGWNLLPSVILALPYYLIAPEIVRYIHNQAFGKYKSQWLLKESDRHFLRYYWDGAGGQMMLGGHKYVVLALCLAGIILLNSRARQNWRFIVGYLAVFAITYLIPALARMENPFFGTSADVLMLFGAVLVLAALLTDARRQASILMRGAAWAMVALSLLIFQWPPAHAHYNKVSEWAQTVNCLGQQLYQTIRDHPGSHNARVFFTAPGPVDDMLFRYNALADGRTFWCPNRHMSSDPAILQTEINAADFVVASEAESGVVYDQMIQPNVQGDALQLARENSRLTELARFSALNGKSFHVFVRRDLTASSAGEKPVPFEEPWSPLYSGE